MSKRGRKRRKFTVDLRFAPMRAGTRPISVVVPAEAGVQPLRKEGTVNLNPGARLAPGQASPG